MKSARIYLFCNKFNTIDFEVPAASNGKLPVDHAAGLLAMNCLTRGQSPSDYRIMIQAPFDITGLAEKAAKLLEAGRVHQPGVKLTRREEEVLPGVLRGLGNKQIASDLNITESTVKFHVKSLFLKFNVHGRMELVRAAAARGSN